MLEDEPPNGYRDLSRTLAGVQLNSFTKNRHMG